MSMRRFLSIAYRAITLLGEEPKEDWSQNAANRRVSRKIRFLTIGNSLRGSDLMSDKSRPKNRLWASFLRLFSR